MKNFFEPMTLKKFREWSDDHLDEAASLDRSGKGFVICHACPVTNAAVEKIKEKFPVFAALPLDSTNPDLRSWADQRLIVKEGDQTFLTASYWMPSAVPDNYGVYTIEGDGASHETKPEWPYEGLRFEARLLFDANSEVVQSRRYVKRSLTDGERTVESVAPIVSFLGNDYVWLNEEECKQGDDAALWLVSDKATEAACPFDILGSNDFEDASVLRNQMHRVMLRNANGYPCKEEALICMMKLSKENNYKSAALFETVPQLKENTSDRLDEELDEAFFEEFEEGDETSV